MAADPVDAPPPQLAQLLAIENQLREFCDIVQLILCRRCDDGTVPPKAKDFTELQRRPHHPGYFWYFVRARRPIHPRHWRHWAHNTQHGLCHGLMTAFFAYLLDPTKFTTNFRYASRILASCLLHDFVRTISNSDSDSGRHAKRLQTYFNRVRSDAFWHSNPKRITPLVAADRIELARFGDYRQWCDKRQADAVDRLAAFPTECFFRYVRPAICQALEGRQDIWIRHGVEELDRLTDGTTYPVVGTYQNMRPQQPTHAWSAEYDVLPFERCFQHGGDKWSPQFIIRWTTLRKYQGELTQASVRHGRDHFVGTYQDVPWNCWCLLWKKLASEFPRVPAYIHRRYGGAVSRDVLNQIVVLSDQLLAGMSIFNDQNPSRRILDSASDRIMTSNHFESVRVE